jgi:hypothetical protein
MLKEVNNLVSNGKDFATDSVRFLNKCTKPDKKGRISVICRVHEDRQFLRHRIRYHGSHWIRYQVGFHPHQ